MEARRVGRRVQGTHRATLRDVQGACRRRARRAEGRARRQVGRGRPVAGQGRPRATRRRRRRPPPRPAPPLRWRARPTDPRQRRRRLGDGPRARVGVRRRARRCLRPGRAARPRPSRFSLPAAAARDGAGGRPGDRRARAADRRGRDRHRQDLRLPRPGAALRRQGDRVDRAPRRCRTSCSSATCRPCATRWRCRRHWRCSRAAPTTSATTTSRAPPREGRLPSRDDARHLPRIVAFAARQHDRRPRRTCRCPGDRRRSGRWSPRRATTASAASARTTATASC